MRVLGIDPGTLAMGYGLIEEKNNEIQMLDCGVLTISKKTSASERLHQLYLGLLAILSDGHPAEMAIEEPFVARNIRSALAIGRAQAVAMLAAANKGIPVYGYPPAKVSNRSVDATGSHGAPQVPHLQKGPVGPRGIPLRFLWHDVVGVGPDHGSGHAQRPKDVLLHEDVEGLPGD